MRDIIDRMSWIFMDDDDEGYYWSNVMNIHGWWWWGILLIECHEYSWMMMRDNIDRMSWIFMDDDEGYYWSNVMNIHGWWWWGILLIECHEYSWMMMRDIIDRMSWIFMDDDEGYYWSNVMSSELLPETDRISSIHEWWWDIEIVGHSNMPRQVNCDSIIWLVFHIGLFLDYSSTLAYMEENVAYYSLYYIPIFEKDPRERERNENIGIGRILVPIDGLGNSFLSGWLSRYRYQTFIFRILSTECIE